MPNSNNAGYAEPKRLLLGIGDLYIDDVFVGNLKEAVTFNVSREYAYQKPGNSLADVKGAVTKEEVTLEASVCDLKLSQLRRALGINQALDTSTAKQIRKRQVLQLPSTTNVTLAETAVAATMKVSSLDRKSSYVSSTDYSATTTTVARKSGGAITSGQYVIVEYDFSDSGAHSLRFGGENIAPNTFQVDFVHEDSSGKRWQITLWKAMTNTDFSIAFNEQESGDFTVHNISFRALVDLTKPEGQNQYEIVQEDANS